jgi:hypothetical protein
VVAGPIFDCLEQGEDLAPTEDPLGQFLLEGRPMDRRAGVERPVPHPVANDSSDLSAYQHHISAVRKGALVQS